MEIIKLLVVFAVLVCLIIMSKPIYIAVLASSVTACVVYMIPPMEIITVAAKAVVSKGTISTLAVLYLVTLLQRMMQSRGHIALANGSLSALFNNRRVNASAAPMFIGLLPTVGAAFIAGDMVEEATSDYLDQKEKAAATTFFRHVPEAFMPTYPAILIGLAISGVPAYSFVLGMIIPVIFIIIVGYFFFLHKVPKDTGVLSEGSRKKHLSNLFFSMWSMALLIILILAFKMEVYTASILVLVLYFVLNKFHFGKMPPLLKEAFEGNVMLTVIFLMVFKDILTVAGVINSLPAMFAELPLPPAIVFMMVFFLGSLVSGAQAIVVVCLPMAYLSMPDGGMPLLVLLMCAAFAATQLSPTHICLVVISQYFKINVLALIKQILPVFVLFMVFAPLYYLLLCTIGF